MKKCLFFLAAVLTLFSCSKDENRGLVRATITATSPFNDPIWHPSGEIIGFNHLPVVEIHAEDNGLQYAWYYDEDLRGFWLVDADGANMRRVLPYYLDTPAWSPDGKWIAFSNNAAQICIMPFDGEQFDTTAVQVLTDRGRNFFPAWSYDMKKIIYGQSICNDVECGVWLFDIEKKSFKLIVKYGTWSHWDPRQDSLVYMTSMIENGEHIGDDIYMYDYQDEKSELFYTLKEPNISNKYLQYSPDGKFMAFISLMNNGEGTQLFKILSDGSGLKKLTSDGCPQFSWSPDSKKIVYLNFYDTHIDETTGSFWTMDSDGGNKKPLTYNSFKLVQ